MPTTNFDQDSDCCPDVVPSSVLSPRRWPFDLEWLPVATYLVGGNVRDALLGRHADYLDLDFVMPLGAVETAQAIARYYRAGFVLLDADRKIARVVFEQATADFAQQVGPTLESDLYRRDFTVNAIAYHPQTETLLDPLQGHSDINQGLIRMVSRENLEEDPLRLLRAYRQAAQLGFRVESQTRAAIQNLAGLLQNVAPERVQSEVSYLLSTPDGTGMLMLAWQDGLLKHWLPHITQERLQRVAQIDQSAASLSASMPKFDEVLKSWIRDQQKASASQRNWLKIAKLTQLVSDDIDEAEHELWRLKYSRAEVHAVLTLLRVMPQLSTDTLPYLSRRDLYFFFQTVGVTLPAAAVLAVALGRSTEAIAPIVSRFLDKDDPIAHPHPLLSGRDLMTKLDIPPGPQVGHLLEAIQIARAEGKIASADDALSFAKTRLEHGTLE
ncbi:MAG: CCA tRNA nucleotidyltransferase [Elainellaceae cyanobacterium]